MWSVVDFAAVEGLGPLVFFLRPAISRDCIWYMSGKKRGSATTARQASLLGGSYPPSRPASGRATLYSSKTKTTLAHEMPCLSLGNDLGLEGQATTCNR
jgi:hypothetical protein